MKSEQKGKNNRAKKKAAHNEKCKRNKRGRNDVIIVLKNSKPYGWYLLECVPISTESLFCRCLIYSHGEMIGSEEMDAVMKLLCDGVKSIVLLMCWLPIILHQQGVRMMHIRNWFNCIGIQLKFFYLCNHRLHPCIDSNRLLHAYNFIQ